MQRFSKISSNSIGASTIKHRITTLECYLLLLNETPPSAFTLLLLQQRPARLYMPSVCDVFKAVMALTWFQSLPSAVAMYHASPVSQRVSHELE